MSKITEYIKANWPEKYWPPEAAKVDEWLDTQIPFLAAYFVEYHNPWNILIPMAMLNETLLRSFLEHPGTYTLVGERRADVYAMWEAFKNIIDYEAGLVDERDYDLIVTGLELYATNFLGLWD